MGVIGTPQLVDATSKVDDHFYRTYTRTYYLWATTDVSEAYILAHLGFGIHSAHPDDAGSFVVSIQVSSPRKVAYDSGANPGGAGSPPANGTLVFQWDLVAEYGPWSPFERTDSGDPTAQAPEIKFNGVNYEQIVDVDIFGNPVVNTVGDYFDPPVTRDQVRGVLEVTRNEVGFSPSTVLGYANKVNDAPWNGFAARTVKIAPPSVVPQYSQFSGEIYSRVTYAFEFDPDGWDRTILNQGTRYLSYGTGGCGGGGVRRYNCRDDKGDLVTAPVLLDSLGRVLAQPINSSNVVVLNYQVYETLDFSTLDLDGIFTY